MDLKSKIIGVKNKFLLKTQFQVHFYVKFMEFMN